MTAARRIRPLLSFVTQPVVQAAEVRWDTAVVEIKVTLTALVNLFLCDICLRFEWVGGLCGASAAAGSSLLSFVSQRLFGRQVLAHTFKTSDSSVCGQ